MKNKKIISIAIILNLMVATLLPILSINNYSIANDDSYEGVAPEFYGAIEINVNVGDSIDFDNALFRIFAKDSEDGDLTQSIITKSNNVNTSVAGNYEVVYEVKDSDEHTTSQTVKVNVAASGERTVKRKLYHKENQYQEDYGITSSYSQDRQNLGIYMPAGTSIQMKLLDTLNEDQELDVSLMNNDHIKDTDTTITENWTTVSAEYDSIPFVTTTNMVKNVVLKQEATAEEFVCEVNENYITSDYEIQFANVFKTNGNGAKLKQIKLPDFGLANTVEIWLNTQDGDITSDNFECVHQSYSQGAKVVFDEPIEITSETFSIRAKVTYPSEASIAIAAATATNNYTYMYNYTTNEWTNNLTIEGGYNNIEPISCTFEQESDLVEMKIDNIYFENTTNTDKVKILTYFLEGDDETAFFERWNANNDTYAVLESDKISFLTPITDKEMLVVTDTPDNHYDFESLQELFDYYDDITNFCNTYCGLEYRTDDLTKKNIYAKIFVRPDRNGAGLAQYEDEYISFNCPEGTDNPYQLGNIYGSHFFSKNWMVIHEIGHGYDNFFRKYDIDLLEAFNNIFSYYVQEKTMSTEDFWVNIEDKEKLIHEFRDALPEGFKFNDIIEATDPDINDGVDQCTVRLYFLIDILNKVGAKQGMQKVFENVRKEVDGKVSFQSQISRTDVLAKSFAEVSGYNPIDYFEYWGMTISEETKEYINSITDEKLYFLIDKVENEQEAAEILQKLNSHLTTVERLKGIQYEGYYCLVTESDIEKCKNDTQGIPSSYDLRDDIDITVKNQYQNGICAYASAASMWETHIKLKQKNGEYQFYGKTPEFSLLTKYESNYIPISVDDTKSVIEKYYNDTTYTEDDVLKNVSGFRIGTLQDELYLLTQNLQISKEAELTKIAKEYGTDGTITYSNPETKKELTDLEVAESRDKIKQHILTNGGIKAGIDTVGFKDGNVTADGLYTGTASQGTKVCYSKEDTPTHGVLIIGWDDNFAKENFPADNRPTTDGAYLVLNSWGSEWGDSGVFYLSYEDGCSERYIRGLEEIEAYTDKVKPGIAFVENDDTIQIVCEDNFGTGLNADSLKYMWTEHNIEPSTDDTNWISFENKEEIAIDATKKYLWAIIEDNAGNRTIATNINNTTGEVIIDGIKLDKEPIWVNEDIELEIIDGNLSVFNFAIWSDTISDEEFEEMRQTTNADSVHDVTLTKDGIHTIYVAKLDNEGNEYIAQKFTIKLDKTKPTASTIAVEGLNVNEKYATNVTVKVTAGTDTLSGVERTDITIVDKAGEEVTVEDKTNFKLTEAGTYTISATTYDNAGNSSIAEKTIQVVELEDLEIPELVMVLEDAEGGAYTSDTWTNKKVYIAAIEGEGTTYKSVETSAQTVAETAESTEITTEGITKIQRVTISGEDVISKDYIIKYDYTNPNLTAEIESVEGTTEKVILKIAADDQISGIESITINDKEIQLVDGKFSYEISTNGGYVVEVSDNAGNITKKSVLVTDINPDTKPEKQDNNENTENKNNEENQNIDKIVEDINTVANTKIPQTGVNIVWILVVLIISTGVLGFCYIKMKK